MSIRTLPATVAGVLAFAALGVAGPAPARVQETSAPSVHRPPIAAAAILVDLSVGPSSYTTIGPAWSAGAGVHARYAFVQAGLTGMLARGREGTLSAAGLELGPVLRDLAGVDVGVFALAGNRSYADVGKIDSTGDYVSSCSGVSGFNGSARYLGARVDVQRAVREGPAALYGVSFYYTRDLITQQLARDGELTCTGFLTDTTSPRRVEATMGGYEIGVAFKIGMSAGF